MRFRYGVSFFLIFFFSKFIGRSGWLYCRSLRFDGGLFHSFFVVVVVNRMISTTLPDDASWPMAMAQCWQKKKSKSPFFFSEKNASSQQPISNSHRFSNMEHMETDLVNLT